MNILTCARLEMNALEPAEREERRPFHGREFQVKLHDFISRGLSRIGHYHIGFNRITRVHRCLWHSKITVAKGRIREAISKRIKRLSPEVAVGAAVHRIVLKI